MQPKAAGIVHQRMWLWFCIALMVACCLAPEMAAAAEGYRVVINPDFACVGTGRTPIPIVKEVPFQDGANSHQGVFSFVMQAYQASLYTAMATGYCAVQAQVAGPLYAAMLIAAVIFAISILLGISKLSIREAMILVFKIALVMMFALNAQIAMKVIFAFFLGLATDFTQWTNPGQGLGLTGPDGSLTRFAAYFSDPANKCSNHVLAFFALFATFFPLIGGPLVMMLLNFGMVFVRAVLGFLTALGAIALLMAASPLFIAFALFRTTYGFFDRWLKSMISYSVQMTLVFFMLMIAVDMFNFYTMFSALEKSLAPTKLGMLSAIVSMDLLTVCTPCQGFKYTGGVGFAGFTCERNVGVPISALLGGDVFREYAMYVVTNVAYYLLLLWGMMQLVVQAPRMAAMLAGDMSSLTLGGRVGRHDAQRGHDERYQFDMNGLDRKMDNFLYGFRMGVDPMFRRDVKNEVRRNDPGYLRPTSGFFAPVERLANGVKLGADMAMSNRSAESIVAHLPGHLRNQQTMDEIQSKIATKQAARESGQRVFTAAKQMFDAGEISADEWEQRKGEFRAIEDDLELEKNELEKAQTEYMKTLSVMQAGD